MDASTDTAGPPAEPQDSAPLLRLMFDDSGEGVCVFDAQWRLTAWNRRFIEATRLQAAALQVGMPMNRLMALLAAHGEFGPGDPELLAERRAQAMRQERPSAAQHVRPDGRTIEIRRCPTADGGLVLLYVDITERQATETALADNQRMLTLLLERTQQGIWFIDNALRTTDANPAMCRMLGLPLEHLIGRSIFEFVDEANERVFREQTAYRSQGRTGGYEITLRRVDGRPVHCFNNATPTFDAAGRKIGAVGMFSDISASVQAQQALRESEARFRTMADAAPALIWQSGPDAQPIWFNQRWLQYTGRDMAGELACSWSARMHPDDYGGCRAAFDIAAARQQAYEIEFRLQRADGAWGWIIDSGIPHFSADGRFEGFIGYGWEITERKATEAALMAAKEEAERANRAKSEFLSRMSHELRTPLNAVLGFGQLLESDARDPLSPAQRGRVRELMRGGRHLLSLINEVLDLASIEAGTLHLHLAPVDLAALVGDCQRLVQPMAAERRIRLEVHPGPDDAGPVLADPTRLKQVLLNLLSNAIKYNREGGSVLLLWGLDPADPERLRIEVRDSGPGLTRSQCERLFQAFERLDAEGTGIEGTGIGLALSKWLVELMRGEIGVRSKLGQGSTFWVRLQRTPPAAEGASAWPPAATAPMPLDALPSGPTTQRHTVLYIEDNPVNQLLMEGMLAARPAVRLLIAGVPAVGLAMAGQARPDLVLLDIQLPDMDGFEVLRRLRESPATRHIPVVAVSANAMQTDLERAEAAGFVDYVVKPLDMARLLAVVDRQLGLTTTP